MWLRVLGLCLTGALVNHGACVLQGRPQQLLRAQVHVDIQTNMAVGGGAAAGGGIPPDVVGPLIQGLLFAVGQGGGFPAASPIAGDPAYGFGFREPR